MRPLKARSSPRRPPAPSRSSTGSRRRPGTSTRPRGRPRRRAPADAGPRSRRVPPAGRPSWIAERNVPGHTQFTLIPSREYSTAATFASWITAAFVAQYGAAWDQAVSPETDAVSTIEPERWDRMTGTAARIPLTAPRTLIRKARSQSSVARLWMRPLGESTPALLIITSRRPKRSTARSTTARTWSTSPTSARAVSTVPVVSPRPATVASSEGSLTSLSTRSVAGSPASRREIAAPSAPPAPVIATTRRCCCGSVIRAGSRRRPSARCR